MLEWKPLYTGNGIYADTGGLGRFVIRTGNVLKHNGEVIRQFDSRDDAMPFAKASFKAMSRYADNDLEPPAMAA